MRNRILLLLFLSGVFLFVSVSTAQQIEFVHEFNTNGDGEPELLFAFQNKLYMRAANNNGHALYTLDAGTSAVECLSCAYTNEWYYYGHGELNGKVYLDINTTNTESQLYVTDGTAAGTQLFKEIYPGHRSLASDFVTYNNLLYFAATDSANGRELWISDGTPGGTYMFWDFRVASDNGNPHDLFVRNNRIYMVAESTTGSLLFCTDGTLPGSQQLYTHFGFGGNVDGVDSLPQMIIYTTNDSLFKIDPVSNTVSLVSDKRYFVDSKFTRYDNKLYFIATSQAGKELYVTDGTDQGSDIFFDSDAVSAIQPAEPFVFNNLLFFSASHAGKGFEPWVTDGNINNTYMFTDLCQTNTSFSSKPYSYTVFNSKLYFSAIDCATNASQLFQTDGTIQGTAVVYYPLAGVAGTYVKNLFVFNGSLYFQAKYDIKGAELYRLTATTGVNSIEKNSFDIYPNPASDQVNIVGLEAGSTVTLFDVCGKQLQQYVIEHTATTLQLNGFAAGTYLLKYNNQCARIVKM